MISRWRYVGIGFAMMLAIGLLDAWSVFVLPLEHEFGWGRDQTSLAYSLAMIFMTLGILLGGPLTDAKGPRIVAFSAGGLVCAGLLAVSYTDSLLQLYIAYSVICGFALGSIYNCVISTVVRWFPDKRGLVTGMLMVGSGLGSLLLGLGITPAFQYLGWRMVFRILAVLSLLTILLPGSLLCRPPETGQGMAGKNSSGMDIDYGWREVVRMPSFWLVWFWHLFVVAGGQAVLGHIVPFAVEAGISVRIAALSMGILAVCNATGRVLFGFLSDRFARRNVMCLAAAVMAAAMACLATLLPYWGSWGLLVSIILTGIAYGGAIPQVSALVASFYGSKHFGANFGLVSTGIAAAALIGPYLSGRMKALTDMYEGSFYFLGFIALIGSILALFTKAPEPRLADMKPEGAILTGKRADSDC